MRDAIVLVLKNKIQFIDETLFKSIHYLPFGSCRVLLQVNQGLYQSFTQRLHRMESTFEVWKDLREDIIKEICSELLNYMKRLFTFKQER